MFERTLRREFRLVSISWAASNNNCLGGTTVTGERMCDGRVAHDARRPPKVGQAVNSLHINTSIFLDRHLRWRGSEIGNPGLAAR